jgi:DNA-binding transcriptional LysR family regulator
MMDRFDAMSVLLAVVEAGSLSAAGRRLGVPLTTVSRKITDLETHLNARLLTRSSRKLDLTEAGRGFVLACKRILGDLIEAERAASGEYTIPKGDLVITAPVVFGRLHLLPVITAFLRDFPQIDITLNLADRMVHLLDDHIDLALRIGTLPDSQMKALRVGHTSRVICASPGYLAANGAPTRPEDLAAHACISFAAFENPQAWAFDALPHPMAIHPRLILNTAEAAIDAAISGLGLTRVLCYQIAAARASGKLATVLEPYQPPPVPISLVYAAQGLLPLKLRAFLDFAAPRLRTALAP